MTSFGHCSSRLVVVVVVVVVVTVVVVVEQAADDVARRSLAGDTDQISSLGTALDRLGELADRLRSDLGRVAREKD